MKKTLIALAAVAATGAAFAQSTVTIDGQVDLGVVKPIGANGARIDVTNGANQIRFRGSEDLGGGLRANFILAQRFSPESGLNDGSANGRPTFQGETTVGLSGGFGSVKIGRALTALGGPVNLTDPWGTLQQGSLAVLASGYSADPRQPDSAGLARTDAIHYTTPSFSGFSGSVSYGFKNSTAGAPTLNTDAFTSLWLAYAAGPLYIGGGAESNRRNDDISTILGTYDFGMFKLGGGYGRVENAAGTEYKNWNIMGIVPLGAVTLKLGYAKSVEDTTDTDVTKKFGIGVDYPLSKRTLIYVSYGRNNAIAAPASKSGYDLGIRHTF
jgi:predicted porin